MSDMKIINYSTARQTLRTVIDDCVNNSEPVIIESQSTGDVVLMDKEQYDMMLDKINGEL